MKVVVYFPEDELKGHSTDYRELHLERVPLVGEHIMIDDNYDLIVREVTTVVEWYDDHTSDVHYSVTAS